MEKQCPQCKIIYNTKRNNQKYCSVNCQIESSKGIKKERIKRICLNCGIEFLKIPSKSAGKYCSRKCKDEHQKEIYKGEKNPSWKRKSSKEEREKRSIMMKKLWEDVEYRKLNNKGKENFIIKNGYYPGTDKNSVEKRKKTMMERYGVPHNWIGKYGTRKCDITTVNVYGKCSADMLMEYTHYYNKKTDIELIFENLLNEMKIPFQTKFRIYNKKKIEFTFREYDFLIDGTKILIEVDGDYWHGNENIFNPLSDFQKLTQEKDRIKELFAAQNGYEVIRFWGTDIKQNIEEIQIKLWEKLN